MVRYACPELLYLIEMCWEADPENRPNMDEVLDFLRRNDPVAVFNKFDKNGSKRLGFASSFTSWTITCRVCFRAKWRSSLRK